MIGSLIRGGLVVSLVAGIGYTIVIVAEVARRGPMVQRVERLIDERCVEAADPVPMGEDYSRPSLAAFGGDQDDCARWYWFWIGPKGGFESRYPGSALPVRHPGFQERYE